MNAALPWLVFAASAAAVEAPVAVSPGHASAVARVEGRCPTFSWGEIDRARSYELVVYRLDDEGVASAEAEPVVRRGFPGSVESWTPALDSCLERGGRYAWSVRAAGAEGASEWSTPSLFEVVAGPSAAEVEAALDVVRRYMGERGAGEPTLGRPTGSGPDAVPGSSSSASGPAPAVSTTSAILTSAATAIRGEIAVDPTQTTGDGVGVLGVADSSGGAGVLAANLSPGGADLVLDGSADSLPDTVLTESGVVAGGSSFEITNTGGTLDLMVNGSVVTTEATDDDTLAGVECGGALGVAKFDGVQWICGDGSGLTNVTASALDFEITGAEVADGSIGTTDVLDGSLTGDDIADGSIEGADIASGTITGGDIGFQQITGVQIASDAINSAKIANGTVSSSDIADGQVFSAEIADGTIVSVDIADGAITRDDIADGTLTGSDIADGTVLSADIGNGTITGTDVANGSLTRVDIGDEAGVEFAEQPGSESVTLPEVVESVTVAAPTSGYVVVTATALVPSIVKISGDGDLECRLTTGTSVDGNDPVVYIEQTHPIALTRGFDLSAGTVTINLLCQSLYGATVTDRSMTAIFSPTRY